jgi:hypothetical protein
MSSDVDINDDDGRFPDESPVEVRYPRSKQEEQGDRERLPRLPATFIEQCGPDQRHVHLEVPDLAARNHVPPGRETNQE